MPNKKGFFLKILVGLSLLLASLFGLTSFQDFPVSSGAQEVEVVEVIDGDTIRVRNLQTNEILRVRYLGIDTPELSGLAHETCFGSQAKEKNEELVLGQNLILELDTDPLDRFGRTLAYVYTLDGLGEKDTFVNLKLAEEGYARFFLDTQNTLRQQELVQATLAAQEGSLGLWGSCGEESFSGECVIKGNVDRLGNKYYHLPEDKYYSQTVVNLLKEDKWLCAVEEAEAQNFQRANP
ncbi:MAG: thermonuclease family protein [Candidatus Yanofskybacteria bacterium]|nr:thermonuclease family protein [Candidatus Yanofskybacteria bacterium]